MKNNSYPDQIKNELAQEPDFCRDTLISLNALKDIAAKMGRPRTAAELKERISEYFTFCKNNSMKPGIESLCLSLNIDRRRFWEWCNGSKGAEVQEICIRARQTLTAFLETSMYNNKINAPAAIFALKNIAKWTDAVQIETSAENGKIETAAALPIFDDNYKIKETVGELPILRESEE